MDCFGAHSILWSVTEVCVGPGRILEFLISVYANEIHSSGSHPGHLYDLIMHYWIKTRWVDWIDMTYGLCKYTLWRYLQRQRSLNKICRGEIGYSLWSMWHPNSRRILFKQGRMMGINPQQQKLIKEFEFWIEYSSIWMLKIGTAGPRHNSRWTIRSNGYKTVQNFQ